MSDDQKVGLAFGLIAGLAALWYFQFPVPRRVKRLLGGPRAPKPADGWTPYVVHYSLPAGAALPDVVVSRYPGLLYAEPTEPDPKHPGRGFQLRTVWRDEPAYRAREQSFQTGTGLPAPEWVGYHRDALVRPRGLWERVSSGKSLALLALLAAGFGNLEKLREAPGVVAGRPKYHVAFDPRELNVLVGDPVEFKVKVHNTRQTTGACRFTFDRPAATRVRADETEGPTDGVTFSDLRLPPIAIKEGAEREFDLIGKAQARGRYKVYLPGRATAGWFDIWPDEFAPEVRYVRVWDTIAVEGGEVQEKVPSRFCTAEFRIAPGVARANGGTIEANLYKAPGYRFESVRNPDGKPFRDLSNDIRVPGGEVMSIPFDTGKLDRMKERGFTVFLVADAEQSVEKWRQVVRAIDWVPGTELQER